MRIKCQVENTFFLRSSLQIPSFHTENSLIFLLDLGQGKFSVLELKREKTGRKEWRMLKKGEISGKEKTDIKTLVKFVGVFCRENHNGEKTPFSFKLLDLREITKNEIPLCPDCNRLLTHGLTMRMKCPHDPKPMCKKCETQCYHGEYKAKIREVMKFSGMYLVKHGRLDLLYHYLR